MRNVVQDMQRRKKTALMAPIRRERLSGACSSHKVPFAGEDLEDKRGNFGGATYERDGLRETTYAAHTHTTAMGKKIRV